MLPVRLVRSFCTDDAAFYLFLQYVSSCVSLDFLNWGSRAVIAMAENPSNRKGERHIDTREHFVDQLVKDRIVKLVQCKPNKMVADALTKNLPAPAFDQHRATMLGEDEAP